MGFEASALLQFLGILGFKAAIANNINTGFWDLIMSAEYHISGFNLPGTSIFIYMGVGRLISLTGTNDSFSFTFDFGILGLVKINDNPFFNNISFDLFIRATVLDYVDVNGYGTYGIKVGFRL